MRRRQALQAGLATAASLAFGTRLTSASNSTPADGPASQDAQPYEPLGSVEVPGAAEAVVTGDGETAVVANGSGFVTVDVADSTDPTVLAEVAGIGPEDGDATVGNVLDVVADGDRVAVAGPANYSDGALCGFAVFDVSDPANPTQVGSFTETRYGNHNVGFEDGHVYRESPTSTVEVWDVTAAPHEQVGSWPLSQVGDGWDAVHGEVNTNIHDLTVQNDRAYVAFWNAGCVVLDVSDPTDPTFLGRAGDHTLAEIEEIINGPNRFSAFIETPGNAHYTAVDDDADVLAVGAEAWDHEETEHVGGPGGITLWDVSDPTAPERLSFVEPPPTPDPTKQFGTWTTAHNFELTNGRLYSSWYQGGVKIHDLSDPANPERLAWWRQPTEAAFWTARVAAPGETFVASTHSGAGSVQGTGGLYVFPDRAGEQADPPALVEENQATDTTTTATATPTATATDTPTPTATPDPSPTPTEAAGDDSSDGGGLPGFGLLAGATGVALGAARALRGDD